ncbi:transcription factor 25 [Drepanopeziza brunnea f. sp. 'multigermtubi' MB_m1]|uniref:Transcription factor 25 n=1 Tax=Marssonina brunnea f. sp. multigermtubi (strain MB_m1) TaxID=1072389 RepID=K1WWK1_MARBU|nr:transcription factor 25 [Drepanopeziza brunnea f. sp. 'multigermtubi' MB_m1]EKD16892.1 transcription factor 25 [Drepanopeziza brunnea f. sp. 'multigermtubi' MB_m1]
MSSRQLRKLQQQRELEQAQLHPQAEEQSEDEPVAPVKTKPGFSFADLADLENEEEEEEEEAGQDSVTEEPTATANPPSSKKPKKAKKKKKAKKAKGFDAEKDEPRDGNGKGNWAGGTDDIDAALRELALKSPPGHVDTRLTVDPEYERVCSLLGINSQHLKVANEMRNLFGKAAVEVMDEPGGPAGRGGRRSRQRAQNQQVDLETALKGHHLPGKGLSELTLRRNIFIQGKDDWPRATTGGLTMAVVDDTTDDGTVEFRYVHDQAYQSLQQTFFGFVEMGDPQNLIALLTRNPYHISLLIQVSKIAKDQTDHALSADLLERALFSFGRASTSLFSTKLSQGKARLDFARPENRELWLAAYQYIKSLLMKGTYRTALEWAKLILSLDPEEDPYCMRLLIHQLSLKAQEFKWLLDVSQSEMSEIWAPSYLGKCLAASHTTPSVAFAALQLKEGTQCRKLLADSMQKLPWLFTHLFKELGLDAPPSIWGAIPRTEAESLFTEMYVLQTKDLWNTPEATALLVEIAYTISKLDVDSIPKLDDSHMTLDVVRFVYLDNTPALMALAPSHLLHRSNNSDSDPLPPDINVYSYEHQRAAIEGRDRGAPGDAFGNFLNPFAAMRGLLPVLRPGADDDDDEVLRDPEVVEFLRREMEEYEAGHPGHDADDDSGNNDEPQDGIRGSYNQPPVSMARRLLNMLWGARMPVGEEDGESENTNTDNEMAELPGQESSEDEMPGSVDT